MSISNLTVGADNLLITSTGTSTPLIINGSLSIATNGSLVVSNAALLAVATTVSINGGLSFDSSSFVATNGPVSLSSIPGANTPLSINGGLTLLNATTLTSASSARTTWLIKGGTNMLFGSLSVGQSGAGTLTALGGQLVLTNSIANGQFNVGDSATGRGILIVSNADVRAHTYRFGNFGIGTLTFNGGTLSAISNLIVGVNASATGFVFVNGGTMVVTNSKHDAAIDVRHGSFILSNGTVLADVFIATNTAGMFINNGGTLIVTSQARVDQGTQTVASGVAQIYSNLVIA